MEVAVRRADAKLEPPYAVLGVRSHELKLCRADLAVLDRSRVPAAHARDELGGVLAQRHDRVLRISECFGPSGGPGKQPRARPSGWWRGSAVARSQVGDRVKEGA